MQLEVRYCPVCSYKMTLLFISYACDRCDDKLPKEQKIALEFDDQTCGWVAWKPDHKKPQFIFATKQQVEFWISKSDSWEGARARPVKSCHKLHWSPDGFTKGNFAHMDRYAMYFEKDAVIVPNLEDYYIFLD